MGISKLGMGDTAALTRSRDGGDFQIRSTRPVTEFTNEEKHLIRQTVENWNIGFNKADVLQKKGIYVNAISKEEAAQARVDLRTATLQKYQTNPREYDKIVKQQDQLFGMKSNTLFGHSGGGYKLPAIETYDGPSGKKIALSSANGRRMSEHDKQLGTSAAGGDQAAAAELKKKGISISVLNAAQVTTAGQLATQQGGNWQRA